MGPHSNPMTAAAAAVAAAAAANNVQHPVLPINGNHSAATHQPNPVTAAPAAHRLPGSYGTFNPSPFNLIYWPYPSPPVSPTTYAFATTHHSPAPAMVNMRGLR